MSQAKDGDAVKVHYTGKLEDGSVFDSSKDRDPLEFKRGSHSVIVGFENGILGMEVGESKSITIPQEDGYGPTRDELVSTVERKVFDKRDIAPEIGKTLQIPQPDGRQYNVRITAVEDDSVTLDGNHPLAGKTLIFDVELIEVG